MIEKNRIFFIFKFILSSSTVYIFSLILILFTVGCGDSSNLVLPETDSRTEDLTGNGVKIVDEFSSFYDNLLKELFENDTITKTDKEIFYFNFAPSHVANTDTLSNSSLICSDTGMNTTSNSFSDNIDSFLRSLRMKIDEYSIKDHFDIAITKNKPSNSKYSTIYLTKSVSDTYCSNYSKNLSGLVRYDKANVKQDDTAFIFYKQDDRNLEELIHVSLDVIFAMLGVERTNTNSYDYSHISTDLGHSNINSMARLLWEVQKNASYDLSLFQEDLDRIKISDIDIPDEFKNIMNAYTNTISQNSSYNNSNTTTGPLRTLFKNLLSGGNDSGFLYQLKNKEQSRLPDFDSYLELDEINSVADLIYTYNNQLSFIKDQNFDLDTLSSLKALLMVGFLQKYYKIKNDSIDN